MQFPDRVRIQFDNTATNAMFATTVYDLDTGQELKNVESLRFDADVEQGPGMELTFLVPDEADMHDGYKRVKIMYRWPNLEITAIHYAQTEQ